MAPVPNWCIYYFRFRHFIFAQNVSVMWTWSHYKISVGEPAMRKDHYQSLPFLSLYSRPRECSNWTWTSNYTPWIFLPSILCPPDLNSPRSTIHRGVRRARMKERRCKFHSPSWATILLGEDYIPNSCIDVQIRISIYYRSENINFKNSEINSYFEAFESSR